MCYLWGGERHRMCAWKSNDSRRNRSFSSTNTNVCVCPRGWARVIRLGGKRLLFRAIFPAVKPLLSLKMAQDGMSVQEMIVVALCVPLSWFTGTLALECLTVISVRVPSSGNDENWCWEQPTLLSHCDQLKGWVKCSGSVILELRVWRQEDSWDLRREFQARLHCLGRESLFQKTQTARFKPLIPTQQQSQADLWVCTWWVPGQPELHSEPFVKNKNPTQKKPKG